MKMNNKKQVQIEKKKKHLQSLRNAKLKRKATNLKRNKPTKIEKQKFLIVCEGENTEPSYFNKFKLTNATVKAFGKGFNTLSLVNEVLKRNDLKNYDQVWCVFDKDDFSNENFNTAIFKAANNNLKVAYSNQAFEYWLLLHFENHQGGKMNRSDYCKKLNKYLTKCNLNFDCDSKIISDDFFDLLFVKKKIAIERAEKIYNKLDQKNPAKEESSTTVFMLVKALMKYY